MPSTKRSSSRGLKLLSVKKSPRPAKKFVATFSQGGRLKSTYFGSTGYQDYTTHHSKERRQRYINRHKRRENWNDPTTAGALSYHLLWGPTTSLKTNLQKFKERFHL
jgi:hypothetical protein